MQPSNNTRWLIRYAYNGEPGVITMTWDGNEPPPLRFAAIRLRESFSEPTPVPDMARLSTEDPTTVQLELFGVRIVGIEPAATKQASDGTPNHGNGLPPTTGA
jgi:hypothetical protein